MLQSYLPNLQNLINLELPSYTPPAATKLPNWFAHSAICATSHHNAKTLTNLTKATDRLGVGVNINKVPRPITGPKTITNANNVAYDVPQAIKTSAGMNTLTMTANRMPIVI